MKIIISIIILFSFMVEGVSQYNEPFRERPSSAIYIAFQPTDLGVGLRGDYHINHWAGDCISGPVWINILKLPLALLYLLKTGWVINMTLAWGSTITGYQVKLSIVRSIRMIKHLIDHGHLK